MMLEIYVIPHFRTLIGSIKKEGDVDENDETNQAQNESSDANVYKISKAYQGIREICDSMLQNVDVLQSSGHHSNTHKNEMFESVLKEFNKDNNNFSSEPNKTLTTQFKNFNKTGSRIKKNGSLDQGTCTRLVCTE
uniref:Uncharacterized protein n=1 Tax=Clytia hemisphaerica TaxID=252671 RepID=A0A7M5WXL3_9CNID